MEATFCLTSYPSLSSISFSSTKPSFLFTSNRKTSYNLSYSYSSALNTSISRLSTINTVGDRIYKYGFNPITCVINDGSRDIHEPQKENKSNNLDTKILSSKVIAGATMVLACTMLGVIMSSSNGRSMQAKALNPDITPKLMTMNKVDGSLFTSMFNYKSQGSGSPPDTSKPSLEKTSPSLKSSRPSFKRGIKKEIEDLVKNEEPEKVIKELRSRLSQYPADEEDEEASFLEMVLIEMLLLQKLYREAALACNRLKEETPGVGMSNPRIAGLKTILYLMTDDYSEAKLNCEEFLELMVEELERESKKISSLK